MADVKGKFITLTGNLMFHYKRQLDEANAILVNTISKGWNELEPEGWYSTALFGLFMDKYAEGSFFGSQAIRMLGEQVYPTIKATSGIPSHIKSIKDFILFEAEGFLLNHRGDDVVARKFLKTEDKHIIVEAPAPGYNQLLYVGVYQGILKMAGINTGIVKYTNPTTHEYDIKW